ncbi:hypothetical protein [Vibrio sp. ES.051]|uniref:hypothetical protein n=1 Tax=Vibrio sp. ES.051 TaxID=1761909 RepID=UPI001C54C6A6|nr:hypothetical protein [Vibrio sp. ES.051]
MSEYVTKGKKSAYKKKQMLRLIAILEDIMAREGDPRLEAIGKRQIIRYWKSIEHETNKTRREKYSILCKFFTVFNPKVTVPEPFVDCAHYGQFMDSKNTLPTS